MIYNQSNVYESCHTSEVERSTTTCVCNKMWKNTNKLMFSKFAYIYT